MGAVHYNWKTKRDIVQSINQGIREGRSIYEAAKELAVVLKRPWKGIATAYYRNSKRRPKVGQPVKQKARASLFLALPKAGGTTDAVQWFPSAADAGKALMSELDKYHFYRAEEVSLVLSVKEE